MEAARAIAVAHWGADPCGGAYTLTWTALDLGTNATASWRNPTDAWNNAGANFDCRIDLNPQADFDFPKLCTVLDPRGRPPARPAARRRARASSCRRTTRRRCRPAERRARRAGARAPSTPPARIDDADGVDIVATDEPRRTLRKTTRGEVKTKTVKRCVPQGARARQARQALPPAKRSRPRQGSRSRAAQAHAQARQALSRAVGRGQPRRDDLRRRDSRDPLQPPHRDASSSPRARARAPGQRRRVAGRRELLVGHELGQRADPRRRRPAGRRPSPRRRRGRTSRPTATGRRATLACARSSASRSASTRPANVTSAPRPRARAARPPAARRRR